MPLSPAVRQKIAIMLKEKQKNGAVVPPKQPFKVSAPMFKPPVDPLANKPITPTGAMPNPPMTQPMFPKLNMGGAKFGGLKKKLKPF